MDAAPPALDLAHDAPAAAAHLQRRRPAELVADIVARTLGPRFTKQVEA